MGEARNSEAEHIENLKKVIASFERARAELVNRRRGITDNAMITIDDRLTVNGRTLDSLKRALEIAEQDLERKRRQQGG